LFVEIGPPLLAVVIRRLKIKKIVSSFFVFKEDLL